MDYLDKLEKLYRSNRISERHLMEALNAYEKEGKKDG